MTACGAVRDRVAAATPAIRAGVEACGRRRSPHPRAHAASVAPTIVYTGCTGNLRTHLRQQVSGGEPGDVVGQDGPESVLAGEVHTEDLLDVQQRVDQSLGVARTGGCGHFEPVGQRVVER